MSATTRSTPPSRRAAPRPRAAARRSSRVALLSLAAPLLLLAGCSPSKAVTPLPVVTVTPADTSIVPGQTVQLTATVSNASDSTVTWSSGVPVVAVVSRSGLVTGVSAGSAVITATVGQASGRSIIIVHDTTAAPP